uniref:Uncharacterized protein n=1 Tax=Solanum lycopersicum TaxID=4081 RepID=A0A3Q7FQ98_SOLLC
MATEQPKPAAKEVKMDLFEDDDEFEEFAIDQGRSSIVDKVEYPLALCFQQGCIVAVAFEFHVVYFLL